MQEIRASSPFTPSAPVRSRNLVTELESALHPVESMPPEQMQALSAYLQSTANSVSSLRRMPLASLPAPRTPEQLLERWSAGGRVVSYTAYALDVRFEEWDANKDGKLTRAELEAAGSKPGLSELDRKAIAMALARFDELVGLSDDGAGKGDGITLADLTALSKKCMKDWQYGAGLDREANSRTRPPGHAERRKKIDEALKSGKTVTVKTSDGKQVQVQVQVRRLGEEWENRYEVKVGSNAFTVRLEAQNMDSLDVLAQLVELYCKVPEKHRGLIKSIVIHAHQIDWPPTEQARVDQFQEGMLRFGYGELFLNEDVFLHEVGHLVGHSRVPEKKHTLGQSQDGTYHSEPFVPPGWQEAMKKDGARPSAYAAKNLSEDFAETYWQYVVNRTLGGQKLAAFEQKFPNRCKILKGLF